MTASANIKTPAMDVPLLPMEEARKKGEDLKKLFTRVHLSDVSSEFYSCSLSVLYVRTYRIAGNFRGVKNSFNSRNGNFCE